MSAEPDKFLLERYVIAQTGKEQPKVAFLPQASGEHQDYIIQFYRAFLDLGCKPSHLSLFQPHTAQIADFLLELGCDLRWRRQHQVDAGIVARVGD